MKQRFVVVDEHESHVLWLKQTLGPQAEAVVADDPTPERVAQITDAASGNVVFVRLDRADLRERAALVTGLLDCKPHLAVVGIGDDDDKEIVLAAMRAGARDFLRVGSDPLEAEAALRRLLSRTPAPQQAGRGEQIAVLCSRPDIAASSFAVHLALRMVETAGPDEKVLLIDLGVPAADSLLYLDIEPSYTFVDAVRSVRRFDQTLIETAFSRDRSGLAVLPLLDDPTQMRDVNGNDMLALFSILKTYFSRTVLNLGGLRSSAFLSQALAQADRTLLLADQSVANCSAARRLLSELEGLRYPVHDIRLVLERYTPKLDPDAAKVAEVLGLSLAATLPPNGFDMVRAMNSATTIYECAPDSPYARGVRGLADGLVGITPEAPRGRAAALARRVHGWWKERAS